MHGAPRDVGSVGNVGRRDGDDLYVGARAPVAARDVMLRRHARSRSDEPDIPDNRPEAIVDAGVERCRVAQSHPTKPTTTPPELTADCLAELFEERAAIREYDGGQSREDAERGAAAELNGWRPSR